MAHESFAQKVLVTLIRLSAKLGEAEVGELSNALMVQTRERHKRMLNALSDLKKAGKVVRLRQGVYAPAPDKSLPSSELRAVMWRLLRMRRRVTVDDLVEMAGASATYALDWLQMLHARGVVSKLTQGAASNPRVWQLINDTVEMPVDTDNAARLRELRKKKKQQALADLAAAQKLLGKAHQAITEMEEDHV
ncbi:MAG: hypothetical protein ACYC9M_02835 [Desulfobulbaceae bacterium]